MDFPARYEERMPRSRELFDRARRIVPAGAGSSARTFKFGWTPYPPFIAQGLGARMTDVDGHEYLDYLLGLGPMILGHRHPVVTKAVQDGDSRPGHLLRRALRARDRGRRRRSSTPCPSLEMVRFTNSGSEAVGTAVRLARAVTGRRLLVRFEGHYHGWQDVVYWSNHVDPDEAGPADHPRPVASGPGVPQELADTLVVLSWNDPDSFQRAHGRARRRDRRGHHRAGHVQHRLHPAAARLPRAAARRDHAGTAPCSSSTRSSPAFASAAAAPRSGTASCPT